MPRHVPSLDGLRAIAVLLVMWSHVPVTMPGYPEWLGLANYVLQPGGFGVELFFALSGFLITRILLAERAMGMPVRWFLLRRVLRIFPIYYLLLLVMIPFRPAAELGWCALYLGNFANVFAPTPGERPLEHTWSLCVEEHFYLLWPLVVAFASTVVSRRVLLWGLIPFGVLGGVYVCATFAPETAKIAVDRLSPFRFMTLAAGALVAYAETGLMADPRRLRRIGFGLIAVAIALHPLIWFVGMPFFWLPHLVELTYWPLEYGPAAARLDSMLLSTGILMWCLVPRGYALSVARPLSAAPLRAIGRISYGLYLYHMPIYVPLLRRDVATRGLADVLLVVSVTFAVATASYWLIERPILRYASRFRNRPAQPAAAAELSS